MKKYGDSIGEGTACILVRAEELGQPENDFWKWLRDEGFTKWPNHGHYHGCDWVFINLNSMIYAPGMPGIKIVTPIRGTNGISVDEFKTIWQIFKYRENHHERSEYRKEPKVKAFSGISPTVPQGGHLCHIYSIQDAQEAEKDLQTDLVKKYGYKTSYRGSVLHSNHDCEDGGRELVRCKKCGALILSQHSYSKEIYFTFDESFYDWLPVWSEEEADLLNIFLDAQDFADCSFRHLRSSNWEYSWTGEDSPRPMDLPELCRAIALKYEKELLSASGDFDSDSPIGEDIWQQIIRNLPNDQSKSGEEYPGIPKGEFDDSFSLYMENPYWRGYYETAPSEVCKEFVAMEFYYSQHQTPEAEDVLCEMEDELGLEDWKHLLKYCGNNPRKGFIMKVIDSFETQDESGIERTGRALLNPYYQGNELQS